VIPSAAIANEHWHPAQMLPANQALALATTVPKARLPTRGASGIIEM